MKRLIDENPSEVFLIEGHTDAVGSNESNLELSDRAPRRSPTSSSTSTASRRRT